MNAIPPAEDKSTTADLAKHCRFVGMQISTQRLYGWTNGLIKRVAQLLRRHGVVGNRKFAEHRRRDTAVLGARNDTRAELIVCLVDGFGRTAKIVKE